MRDGISFIVRRKRYVYFIVFIGPGWMMVLLVYFNTRFHHPIDGIFERREHKGFLEFVIRFVPVVHQLFEGNFIDKKHVSLALHVIVLCVFNALNTIGKKVVVVPEIDLRARKSYFVIIKGAVDFGGGFFR